MKGCEDVGQVKRGKGPRGRQSSDRGGGMRTETEGGCVFWDFGHATLNRNAEFRGLASYFFSFGFSSQICFSKSSLSLSFLGFQASVLSPHASYTLHSFWSPRFGLGISY